MVVLVSVFTTLPSPVKQSIMHYLTSTKCEEQSMASSIVTCVNCSPSTKHGDNKST